MPGFVKVIAIALCLLSVSSQPGRVFAQSFDRVSTLVTVTPAKFDLGGNPGESSGQSLKITNDDDYEALFAVSVENFTMTGEEGELILGQNIDESKNQLSKWIKFARRGGKLQPGETIILDYLIDIPPNAQPGGAYAAIVISMDRVVRNPGESAASSRVVSLVMLTVSGDIREKAAVTNISARRAKDGFDIELGVRNDGNNHIKPSGFLLVTNVFGKSIEKVPYSGENVLPGTTRRMSHAWRPSRPLFGWYRLTFAGTFGEQNNVPISGTAGFLSLPFWFGALIITGIGYMGLIIIKKKISISR